MNERCLVSESLQCKDFLTWFVMFYNWIQPRVRNTDSYLVTMCMYNEYGVELFLLPCGVPGGFDSSVNVHIQTSTAFCFKLKKNNSQKSKKKVIPILIRSNHFSFFTCFGSPKSCSLLDSKRNQEPALVCVCVYTYKNEFIVYFVSFCTCCWLLYRNIRPTALLSA